MVIFNPMAHSGAGKQHKRFGKMRRDFIDQRLLMIDASNSIPNNPCMVYLPT